MRLIRYLLNMVTLLGVLSVGAVGNTIGSISQATQEIAYLSQKIATDYLYLYNTPMQKKSYQVKLNAQIKEMESSIRFIAVNTKDEDIQNILDFLSYGKDKIKALVQDDISRDNAVHMLDESDALVEGLQSIINTKGFSSLDNVLSFHMMKLAKLYMAIHLKIDSMENTEVFNQEVQNIDRIIKNQSTNMQQSWQNYKEIINPNPIYFLPNIISIILHDLEQQVGQR